MSGAPGDVRRPAGRHVRRRRRLQLLSDQESRRARRRRRDHHQRRGARRQTQAAAQRRPDRSLSPRRVRREQPARRNAGRDPARAPDAAAGVDRAAARAGGALPPGPAPARPSRVPPECDPGHVYHLFVVRAERPRRVPGTPGTRRHRHADPLSDADSASAGVRRVCAGASCPVADRVCAEVCSLPLHPQLADADADAVVAAVHAWRPASAGANA